MILECPNCETQYEIPVELPPEGRKVRCASCQHVWTATTPAPPQVSDILSDFGEDEIVYKDAEGEVAEVQDAPAEQEGEPEPVQEPSEPVAESVAEPEPDQESASESEPATEEAGEPISESALEEAFSTAAQEEPLAPAESEPAAAESDVAEEGGEEAESPPIVIGKGRKFRGPVTVNLAAGWAGLAIILTGVAGVSYFQRVNVVRALPGAASAYERIGLPVNVRGIEFEKVKYSWETSAGRPVLEVFGEIVNITSEPVRVPTVVFGLRTKEKVEVYQWAADVRSELLPAGERTAFSAQIPTPPKSIRDVQVRFAKVR